MDDGKASTDWHAEADRTYGPCGDPECPTGRVEPERTQKRHLRLIKPTLGDGPSL